MGEKALGSSPTSIPEIETVHWRVITNRKDESLMLKHLATLAEASPKQVLSKICELAASGESNTTSWRHPVAYIVTMSPLTEPICGTPLTSQVIASDIHKCAQLTAALRRPELISHTNFLSYCSSLLDGHQEGDAIFMRKAIWVRQEYHRSFLMLLRMVGVLISVGAGIMAGFLSHRADAGIACASGLLAVISMVDVHLRAAAG